jgi:hypothetical protein
MSVTRRSRHRGRENGEDHSAEFLVMLNTCEASVRFLSADRPKTPKAIEIARLLGWTAVTNVGGKADQMNHTAKACNSASALISVGYWTRSRFCSR